MYNGISADPITRVWEDGMEQKKKRQRLAAAVLFWLVAVSCKLQFKMPDFFGGITSAIENMFRSIAGKFGP